MKKSNLISKLVFMLLVVVVMGTSMAYADDRNSSDDCNIIKNSVRVMAIGYYPIIFLSRVCAGSEG